MATFQEIKDVLNTYFSLGEIETLCFELNLPFEEIKREGKTNTIVVLVQHVARTRRTAALISYINQQRPHAGLDPSVPPGVPGETLVTPSQITNLPPANPHFVGRTEHLEQLTAGSGQTTITQTISGLGGVGKSQLLLHFAHRQRSDYDIIWWLRVDEALAEDMIALGRQLRLPVDSLDQAAAAQLVRNWLNGSDKRWLLLCDNADKMEPRALRHYLPTNPQGRILISSRNPHWRGLGGVLRLDVFTPAEAAAFWSERLNQPAGLAQSARLGQSELDQLAKELGYLPLALEQAAAYINQNQASAADYLRLFQTRRQELWATTEPPDDYHATIATTWDIGFAEARQTPGAADMLHLCCFLAPAEIPLDLLVDHAEALPDELAAILADPLARNAALAALERYALLTRSDGLLTIHRLVQTVARDRLEAEEAKAWAEVAIKLIHEFFPERAERLHEWTDAAQLLPHITSVIDWAIKQGIQSELLAQLCNQTGYYLQFRGRYVAARLYYEYALTMWEKALDSDHHNEALLQAYALSLNNLGALLRVMGDLVEAWPYYERALVIWEEVLGHNHPSTAITVSDIGLLLHQMGRYEESRPYRERSLRIYRDALGEEHSWTAAAYLNLGSLQQAMGDLTGARAYYERALAIREKALGPNHPDTANSLINLGHLLSEIGDLAGTRQYYERALAINEKTLGHDHPDTAISLNNLGYVLQAMGDLARARPYYERALDIFEKALGRDHPNTANSLNNLGALLQAMGDLAAARQCYERALVIREKAFGHDHPNTALSFNSLGYLLSTMGDLVGARPYYEHALAIRENALNSDHSYTAQSLNNLGMLCSAEGDIVAAVYYLREALVILERALGVDHPNTQTVRQNLAAVKAKL